MQNARARASWTFRVVVEMLINLKLKFDRAENETFQTGRYRPAGIVAKANN